MPSPVKEKIVAEIENKFKESPNVIITEYHGLPVSDIGELRTQLRGARSEYKVLKNRLTRIALNNLGYKQLVDFFKGPVGVVFQKGDPVAVCKVLVKFAKDHEMFKLKTGMFDGAVIDIPWIQKIAKLPSRQVMLGKLVLVLAAPVQNFARALNAIPQNFANALDQVSKKKEEKK